MKKYFSWVIITFLAIAGIVISYLLYQQSVDATLKTHYEQQKILADQAVFAISNFFEVYNNSLQFISKTDEIKYFNEDSKKYYKNYFEAHINVLKGITRVSKHGKIIYTYPYVKEAIGKDISYQKHNAEIITTNKPVISDVFNTIQGYKAIVYAYPIFVDNEYDGCISILIPFNFIAQNFLQNLKLGASGSSFVISENGTELYCKQKEHIGKSALENSQGYDKLQKIINLMLKGKNGFDEYEYYDLEHENIVEKSVFYKKVNLGNTFWSIAIARNKNEIIGDHYSFFHNLLLLFFVVSFLIFTVGYKAWRDKQRTSKLIRLKEEKYMEELETLVDQRTKELNITNETLRQDIIKRKEIENELQRALDQVKKSEKIKSEFLAQMSHEIRTPINTILSFSSLIEQELARNADDDLKYGFLGIRNAGKRLIRTIDLILNMSDLQLGTYQYLPKETDILFEVLKNLDSEYKVLIQEKGLEYEVISKTDNTRVVCDEYSVGQIFANLIDNAIKYTNEGKITIELKRNDNNNLVVSIQDTGLGISDEYLPHIFDEFTQEDKGYTREFDGNGLGLALVKKYVDMNNAIISVESKKGQGTKFTVIFQ